MKINKFYLISSAVALSAISLVILANLPEKNHLKENLPYEATDPYYDLKEECELAGGVWVYVGEPGGGDDYCDLGAIPPNPPNDELPPQAPNSGSSDLKTATPQAQAPNSGLPGLKPAMEVVQYCANKGAKLGGANISFPLDHTLHVEEWFSESFSHVKCVDDITNPRSCWGPEEMIFEVMLCNGTPAQNNDYACKTLPVTLGSCTSEREQNDQPDAVPTSCGHC